MKKIINELKDTLKEDYRTAKKELRAERKVIDLGGAIKSVFKRD